MPPVIMAPVHCHVLSDTFLTQEQDVPGCYANASVLSHCRDLYIGHFSFHMRLKCEMKSKHNEAKRNTLK